MIQTSCFKHDANGSNVFQQFFEKMDTLSITPEFWDVSGQQEYNGVTAPVSKKMSAHFRKLCDECESESKISRLCSNSICLCYLCLQKVHFFVG